MTDTIRRLYLEPTSCCNLNCPMCFRSSWIDEELGFMDWDTFERVVEDEAAFAALESVCFGGMGEPLLHPRLADMVRAAGARGASVEVLTNGTLLTPEISRALLEAGLSKLWVSLDSIGGGGEGALRDDSRRALVLEHIQAFNRLRGMDGRDQEEEFEGAALGIAFTIGRSNLHELPHLLDYCMSLGAESVNISNLIPCRPEEHGEILYEKILRTNARWQYIDREKKAVAPVVDVRVPLTDLSDPEIIRNINSLFYSYCKFTLGEHSLHEKARYCRFVREGCVFVRHDGAVSPCMALLHSTRTYYLEQEHIIWHYSFGNVREQPLSRIWSGAPYTEFRERVTQFSFSPCMYCDGCFLRAENREDCYNNPEPVCGACIWAGGIVSCP